MMARVALLAQKCHYGLGKHKTSRDSPYLDCDDRGLPSAGVEDCLACCDPV